MPIAGTGATVTAAGGGVAQLFQLFGTSRFVKGFANGTSSDEALLPLDEVESKSRALDGMPAFRSAILVVSLLNIPEVLDRWASMASGVLKDVYMFAHDQANGGGPAVSCGRTCLRHVETCRRVRTAGAINVAWSNPCMLFLARTQYTSGRPLSDVSNPPG